MNRSVSSPYCLSYSCRYRPPSASSSGVRAPLHDVALLQHQDLVRAADGREPVRDHEGRAPRAQRAAGRRWISASLSLSRLDVASSRIRMRGSARIARAIATRCRCPPESFTPALAHDGVVPLGEALARTRRSAPCPAGREDLGARGARLGEGDVLGDGAVEEEVVLQHHAQLAPVVAQPQRRRGPSVDQHPPHVGAVERHDQARSSCSCPTRSSPPAPSSFPPARGS